jgi:hypothetical protein
MRDRIIAAIALGVRRIANEHTRKGVRGELVRSCGGCTGIAATTKDVEIIIGGRCAKEKVVWCILPGGRQGRMLMRRVAVASASGQKHGGM